MLDDIDNKATASTPKPDEIENLERRSLFKYSFAGGITAFAANHAMAADPVPLPVIYPPSPPIIPWQETFPAYLTQAKAPVGELDPPPQQNSNVGFGECGRNPIQGWEHFYGDDNHDTYELHVKEGMHVFNPAYPPQPIWGYDGVYPGPTFHAYYGRTVITRLFNELPQNHVGFGSPELTMHLHNAHTPTESDGFPGDFWSPVKNGPTLASPGNFKDHCYPNVYAGYLQSRVNDPNAIGDPREALGTLWYHDHTLDSTGPNIARGLAGFYLLFDAIDSGNENDFDNPQALRLPSGEFDVPIIFQDKRFDASGMQIYDQMNPEGILGDQVVVNGKIKPYLKVARRRYRFRLLDGGPTRFYQFNLVHNKVAKPFIYIANDGNLLEYPLMNQTKVTLGVAERADIIVDFSAFPIGSEVYLVNRMEQEDPRKPKGTYAGVQVLKFIVDRNPTEHDNSRVLTATTKLRDLPPIDLTEVAARRTWEFGRKNGVWTVNEKIFEINNPRAKPKLGTAEIWKLVNGGGGWAHPVHIHFEEGRILTRNGVAPPLHERGRKDVYPLFPGDTVEVFIRFRDFPGKYVMHCHNTPHEDHAMMVRFDLE